MFADFGPDGQQDTLALVVAGPVLVGLTEVAGDDRPLDRADDLAQRDGIGLAGQDVAAADTTLGANQAGALQREKDLLQVGLGKAGPVGETFTPPSYAL